MKTPTHDKVGEAMPHPQEVINYLNECVEAQGGAWPLTKVAISASVVDDIIKLLTPSAERAPEDRNQILQAATEFAQHALKKRADNWKSQSNHGRQDEALQCREAIALAISGLKSSAPSASGSPVEQDTWNSAVDAAARTAMDMPLTSGEERHEYRVSNTYKAAALEISNAIRGLKRAT